MKKLWVRGCQPCAADRLQQRPVAMLLAEMCLCRKQFWPVVHAHAALKIADLTEMQNQTGTDPDLT